jgi:glycosyltransferase involved in cell wall biosynthesis
LTKKLGVDKQVIFTGWLEKEDLWKIYLASDLFVLPSKSEGMSNAMLEALGSGLPCLGSNIPGIKDILLYEELLFESSDEKALARKIKQFFSKDDISNRAYQLCEERKQSFCFDWKERIFEMIMKPYT